PALPHPADPAAEGLRPGRGHRPAREQVLERRDQVAATGSRAMDSEAELVVHPASRSEEQTSELQSLTNLVCRLLLEKKKHNHQTVELSQKIKRKLYQFHLSHASEVDQMTTNMTEDKQKDAPGDGSHGVKRHIEHATV